MRERYLAKSKTFNKSKQKGEVRKLSLLVSYGYDGELQTRSKDVTGEIIIETMHSINWSEFHLVILEDVQGNLLEVGGSIDIDGFSSVIQTYNLEKVIQSAPDTVEDMTHILLTYLKGEEYLLEEYRYC